jgi:hypothetical protein
MDTTEIITGIALIGIIIIPFFLHHLKKKKKEAKFLNDLLSLAKNEDSIISQKDFWRECYAIGIDENSKKLLYINKIKDKEQKTAIDLSEVERCSIVNASRSVKIPKGNLTVLDRIDLVFTFNRADLSEKTLEFYDSTTFMTPDGEIPLVEKWMAIINSNLKTNKN